MYILLTGAPGSKWSSVNKTIYWSKDIDQTDYSEARTYWHDADTPGTKQLMHLGAYWDPGMEFDLEDWDKPFSDSGKRIIKSHTMAHKLWQYRSLNYPIVMVYRNDYECLKWWKLCGEFNITYPNYAYFENWKKMLDHIHKENADILKFVRSHEERITRVDDNVSLCKLLDIAYPEKEELHNYSQKDITVYVYK